MLKIEIRRKKEDSAEKEDLAEKGDLAETELGYNAVAQIKRKAFRLNPATADHKLQHR